MRAGAHGPPPSKQRRGRWPRRFLLLRQQHVSTSKHTTNATVCFEAAWGLGKRRRRPQQWPYAQSTALPPGRTMPLLPPLKAARHTSDQQRHGSHCQRSHRPARSDGLHQRRRGEGGQIWSTRVHWASKLQLLSAKRCWLARSCASQPCFDTCNGSEFHCPISTAQTNRPHFSCQLILSSPMLQSCRRRRPPQRQPPPWHQAWCRQTGGRKNW